MKQPFIIFPEISASTFPDNADNWVKREEISSNANLRWSRWLAAPRYRLRYNRDARNLEVECCPIPGLEQLKADTQHEEAVANVYLDAQSPGYHPRMLSIDQSGCIAHTGGEEIGRIRMDEFEPGEVSGENMFRRNCLKISKWDQESIGRWYDAACYILFCECLTGNLGLQESDRITTAIYARERLLAKVAIMQMKWMLDTVVAERLHDAG